ncbi:semaphorin-4B-like [Carcharodon carcharias]|uniref:semaphorin-4B-like n=1 Tax=Carcharodon carcharias TaxID=13397 RepID=UPI001B7E6099|nr:semaphorin-4B-like [Carcharodon carcharias]XP_041035718.1 semaphorin-4B-like [Carcharodon carcharias]XP_041035720.1 semaphorin-4B-like [Carcharodon carcharias]XP_041035721.1 semaphorin-4B-like [Carcharodon carcharias]
MDSWLAGLTLLLAVLEEAFPLYPTQDATPRISFLHSDPSRTFTRFSKEGFWNYSTLLLSEDEGRLYVGAHDILFSVDTATVGNMELIKELPWKPMEAKVQECSFKGKSKEQDCLNFICVLLPVNESHFYTCGTYAFSPTCAYIDVRTFSLLSDSNGVPLMEEGKGRCPFDPRRKYTATMVDGELYTGTTNNFQGTESIIARNLGQQVALKTEPSFNWLQDPTFVGSAFIQESEGDKIYFFFTESRQNSDLLQKMSLSLVARVCKSDNGGERVLQKRWTTFLKAQLLCYLPEDQFPFNVLQDMFVSKDEEGSVFYGVFGSQWFRGASDSSAVCAFTLHDIQTVFNGLYKLLNRETQTWSSFSADGLDMRPGSCNTKPWMDSTLNLVKDRFMMDGVVHPTGHQPQLVKLKEKYLKIAVDSVLSVNLMKHRVMFLITARGFLHKALCVNGTSYIIEELQLFSTPQSVHSLVLSPEKGVLYIGSSIGVLQVPLSNCTAYLSCGDCVLSRDPYCAWDRDDRVCKETRNQPEMRNWVQDIENANAALACSPRPQPRMQAPKETQKDPSAPLVEKVRANSLVNLRCQANSNLARKSWTHKGAEPLTSGLIPQPSGLSFVVTAEHQGLWECWATENQFRVLLVSYSLQITDPALWEANQGLQSHTNPALKTYWSELVVVSVLFVLFAVLVAAFALRSYSERLRSRCKVRAGASAKAESGPVSGSCLETAPLNKGPVSNGSYQNLQDEEGGAVSAGGEQEESGGQATSTESLKNRGRPSAQAQADI